MGSRYGTWHGLSAFILIATLFALAGSAIAVESTGPQYDVSVWSTDFQPGTAVYINITGPANTSVSVRITDSSGYIVSGRDAVLNSYGKYIHAWVPTQDGEYNATVTFFNGLSISRKFLIQQRVTPAQIGDIYKTIFSLKDGLLKNLEELRTIAYVATGLAMVSLLTTIGLFLRLHQKKQFSHAESEFERFLKQDVETAIKRLASSGTDSKKTK